MRMDNRFRVGKTYISATNLPDAKKRIEEVASRKNGGYVCVSNVRAVVYANGHGDYRNVMAKAVMCLPDGMPLVWMAHLWGLKNVQRSTGPDLMTEMLRDAKSGIKHFLLGDTDEILSQIKSKYTNEYSSLIVGTYSPEFCDLDSYDYEKIASIVNASEADVVWIALRAPKQDFFASRLCPFLKGKICIGVGAAFRFSLGEIKHPPKIFQRLALTGFFWRKISIKTIMLYIYYSITIIYYGIGILLARLFNRKPNAVFNKN